MITETFLISNVIRGTLAIVSVSWMKERLLAVV
jgi:hypothetical protein